MGLLGAYANERGAHIVDVARFDTDSFPNTTLSFLSVIGTFPYNFDILAFRAKAVGFGVRIGFRLLFSDANKPRLHVIITD
uniref:Uncharacterized protein n=1 Tax=Candidatus Kentrum sp. LPFa TaxID=2126335 RepID=A0A450WQN8_9GAMM|nr:MAG: hypothetical protein BECKLPF1236B_GA0070989_11699 [Candidatus Kentron sp. LPFa]